MSLRRLWLIALVVCFLSLSPLGFAQQGFAQQGSAQHGFAQQDSAEQGFAQQGSAQQGQAVPPAGVATAHPTSGLGKHFSGLEVARCLFPQGKLVLKRGAELHVLRVGDPVPGAPGLRVLEMTDHHAVLAQGPSGSGANSRNSAVPIPERLIKIEKRIDGEVTVTVMSARNPRAEGPELGGEEQIYSPWAPEAGQDQKSAPYAPLVTPRQVATPEVAEPGTTGSEQGGRP